jgi:phosphoribosyl-ATP pyrophosphohydrolase
MNMLFFRSEEYLNQWLESKKAARGAVLSTEKVWELSQLWYHNRLSLDYHGRTVQQVQEIFKELGLTSEFWRIG